MNKTTTASGEPVRAGKLQLAAIDPASTSGVAYGPVGGTPELTVIRFRKAGDSHIHSYGRVAAWAIEMAMERGVDAIAIENPILAWGESHYQTITWLNGVFAVVVGIMQAHGVLVLPVAVNTWRKAFLGIGNLHTAEAKAAAMEQCRRLGWQTDSADAAEAAGIWHWACGELKSLELGGGLPVIERTHS